MTRTRWSALVPVALALVLLSGCAVLASPSRSASPRPTASGPSAGPSAEAVGGCRLVLTRGERLETTDPSFNIVATNRGSGSCRVTGYPTIEFLRADGEPADVRVFLQPLRGFPGETVALTPGHSAYAYLSFAVHSEVPGACVASDAVRLRVTLPVDTARPLTIDVTSVSVCRDERGFFQSVGPFRKDPISAGDLS